MTSRNDITRWLHSYQRAARSDDPKDVAALFTKDAEYHDEPFGEPWRGRDEIVRRWIEQSDAKLEWDLSHRVVAVDGSTAVLEVEYLYTSPEHRHTYRSIWLVELDDEGRARSFKDYWVEDPQTKESAPDRI